MKIKKYLNFVCGARSLEELWHGHVQQMGEFGFDRLIYGYTRYKTETSLGDPEDFVVLSNHDETYLEGFLNKGLYFHAPMLRWALENEGAGSWRIVQEMEANGDLGPEARKVLEFNQALDITAGYTVSFYSASPRYKGAISLGARRGLSQDAVDALWEKSGDDIVLMNNVAHLKIQTLPYAARKRNLTKRQREVLQWVGDGKTTQDIALLMGLTPATIEKHLRLARETLSVETTAQAVLKAALHNQMYVMDA
ncbi:LuxR family transcriptional regulator [Leisingera daeponensis]|uniref:LuxR family transcriptional regulator n=1 Tax=Leisingera daeponensis TaxID=405746 RepID=A0ABS7NAZ9_9RHOB|nr:autoinducer binding domain-containing protein [Leisingera daeponensis]MBY6138373.1 LuxR family transcriptional regulator [Leisingera daeponensis]